MNPNHVESITLADLQFTNASKIHVENASSTSSRLVCFRLPWRLLGYATHPAATKRACVRAPASVICT